MGNKKYQELVVCSAIKLFNITDVSIEIVIPCVRHWDSYVSEIITQFSYDEWQEKEQGFITNLGRFVDRKEALEIAKRNNQIKFSIGYEPDELYSEMLY